MKEKLLKLLSKANRALRQIKAYLPGKLPVGVEEFNAWSDEVLDLYGAPNNDSFKFALATMILHAGEASSYLPKHYFGARLRKAMINQVVSQLIQDVKKKQQEAAAQSAQA